MNSRMDKYYEEPEEPTSSRSEKNQDLYQEMNTSELESFDVHSNVSVLGDNGSVIDVDKLRDMLDKKYRETPKRKSINVELPEEDAPISLDETREYDINTILAKAKEEQVIDYEVERLKKLRDTQYDILKKLDVIESSKKEEPLRGAEKLMDLINTITIKETELEEDHSDPLDILSDLKGSGQTEVLQGLREEIERTMIGNQEEKEEIKEAVKEESKNQIDKSFYTNSMSFTQSDFDDFNDLKQEVKSHKLLIRFLIVLIVLAFLFGVFLLLNNFLGWGIL